MTKLSNKKHFPHFWGKNYKKLGCHAQHHMGLKHHSEFQEKLMSQSQENLQIDPSTHGRGSKKVVLY